MSASLLDTFDHRLRRMRSDLLARLAEQRGESLSRADAAARSREQASDDWAQADAEQDLELAMSEREQAELEAIEQALARLEQGEYGLCIDCGADIGVARLSANPLASRCISCQTEYERRYPAPHASL
jgi:DnaK suppressor protein